MRVAVVGAGIAGLACACRLGKLGAEVTVLEAEPRPGGVIRTEQVDGFRFEAGPQTCVATPALRVLATVFGLELIERTLSPRSATRRACDGSTSGSRSFPGSISSGTPTGPSRSGM